ncbi:MAG TPA: methylmalonyl-CoA epimerase [Thermoplasmata archaeon]|nr:methylmalonyl-CoA epimerase [Thermoplasmata archaeon]
MKVDHLGIAVKSLRDSLPVWEATLGTRGSPPEEVPSQRVRVSFLEAGEPHLELLEPTAEGSAVARFLADRGEGMHHVAFAVPRVDDALAAVEQRGGRLVDRVGRPGARGRRVGFAHPSAHHGVLVEFVEGP